MKRNRLVQLLSESPIKIDDTVELYLSQTEASAIIERLEELGMMPPPFYLGKYDIYEWESED